jgi:protein-tyrosine phosphatase
MLKNAGKSSFSRSFGYMIKILFICHGNICRSTMAESVFTHIVATAGRMAEFEIDSAATSREEIGNGPHYGTKNKLAEEGIPLVPHRARQMTRDDYLYYDYLIGMDTANIRNMMRIAGGSDPQGKIYKLLSFADYRPGQGLREARDVADPWYTGDFDRTYEDVRKGCEGLYDYL